MPYTIAKGSLWFALALVLGLIIGYLLRSIVANRQIRAARAGARPDSQELDRLRGRVANLEPVVAERDRLRVELDACRDGASNDDPVGFVTLPEEARLEETKLTDAAPPIESEAPSAAAESESTIAEVDDPAAESPEVGAGDTDGDASVNEDASVNDEGAAAPVFPATSVPPASPDVTGAAAILGKKIKLDDLTAVEGIGPAIAELCNGIGIHTWFDLSTTEVSLLRTMLDDAGPRYRVHDPSTWPEQATLLANGDWQTFRQLTDELDHGKRV